MFFRSFIFVAMLAGQTAAECPALPERQTERSDLLEKLAKADDYGTAQRAANALWQFWHVAPDEISQEMLDSGVDAIRYGNYILAEETLTRLIRYCPEYGEGHNQLAFVYFLRRQDSKSLDLLTRALELEPAHFGALSGIALIHIRNGRTALGHIYLRRAVALHPWLNERALLEQPVPDGSTANEL
ncbi:tetratricopeptide repeat protein [Neptunicoccus sediminis]|uniref:tetratricopeptide repeat protein n=1 Tax=Neptunicoccus sediminis TaxID=1892596 RepID=UPI000845FB11|nr:hypothetical protein [Neptunicoccus sediminis]